MKGTKEGKGPGMGSMSKGKSGSGRTVDHPNMGGKVGKRINNGSPGSECKSPRESGKKIPNRKPVCFAQGPQVVK